MVDLVLNSQKTDWRRGKVKEKKIEDKFLKKRGPVKMAGEVEDRR